MKKSIIALIFLSSLVGIAQVGINNTDPKASLDITATNQATPTNTDGILIPRVDAFPITNPTATQQGMMVYLTTTSGSNPPGFYYWDNNAGPAAWVSVVGGTVQKLNDLSDGKSDSDGTNDGSSVFLGINAGAVDDLSDNRNVGVGYQSLSNNTTGSNNTANGYQSLFNNTTGFQNTAIGNQSLFNNTTGYQNTAFGALSLRSNTTGFNNTALGFFSLYSNTTGEANTAIGYWALRLNTTGNGNIAIGREALTTNSTGNGNTATGVYSMQSNTTGISNTAYGGLSLQFNNTGTGNVALGVSALKNNTTGGLNVATGTLSLASNNNGVSNVANGNRSLRYNTSGNYNTALGDGSLFSNISGNNSVALGANAGYNTTTGDGNVFLGYNSGYNETGSNKLYIENTNADSDNALIYGEFDNDILRTNGEFQIGNPTGTGYAFPTIDGTANQLMQTDGAGNVSWVNNDTVGTDNQNITGSGLSGTNLTIGIENGTSQTVDLSFLQDGTGTDDQNISGSSLSGTNLTIGIENGTSQVVNLASLQDGTGTDDQNISGSSLSGTNLTIGIESGSSQVINLASLQDGTGTDDQNISGSSLSGTNLTIGIENGTSQVVNLASLQDADWFEAGGTPPNAIGDNIYTNGNVGINNATPNDMLDIYGNSNGANSHIQITESVANDGARLRFANGIETTNQWLLYGRADNTIAESRFSINHTTTGNIIHIRGDGRVGINNSAPTYALDLPNNATISVGQARANAWVTYSDSRLKKNQKPLDYGLNEILKLQPKSYLQYASEFKEGKLLLLSNSEKKEIGFIAQELYKIIPEATYKPKDENKDLWSVNYEKIIPVAVQAIKELNDKVETLKEENKQQQEEILKLMTLLNKYEQIEARLIKIETQSDLLNSLKNQAISNNLKK